MTTFPLKLHAILSDNGFEDIITWLPSGHSWRVLDRHIFEKQVIPLYFRHSNYSSFMRQLNGWGFRRVDCGDTYEHELFQKKSLSLCMKMKRIRKDTHKVPAVTVVEQPSSQLAPLARQGNVTQLKEVPKTSQCLIHPCESIRTTLQISTQNSITYPTQKNGKILKIQTGLFNMLQPGLWNNTLERSTRSRFEQSFLQPQQYNRKIAELKLQLELDYIFSARIKRLLAHQQLAEMMRKPSYPQI